jgi:hypothetical protein
LPGGRESSKPVSGPEGPAEGVVAAPAGGHGVGWGDRVPQPLRDPPGNAEAVPAAHQHSQGDGNGRVVRALIIVILLL